MAKLLSNTRIYGTGTVDTQLFVKGFQSVHSTATGALQVSGGIGVAGGGFFSGAVTATNFVGAFSGTASSANDIAGGTAGQLLYQISPGDTGFVGPGTAGQLLVSAGASIPVYTNTASIYVNSSVFAEDLRGGTAGQLVYQSAANTTAFAGPGTAGQVLTSAGTGAPVYVTTTTLYVGNSVTATNLRGGAANQFAYQTGAGATAFINTGSMYVGRAVIADTVIGGGSTVQTTEQTNNASYYLTFVDSNNATATAESVYTTSTLIINPATGTVNIGTTSSLGKLTVSDPGATTFTLERISNDTGPPEAIGRKSRGSTGAKTGVLSGDRLWFFAAAGYVGTEGSGGAYSANRVGMNFVASETWTGSAQGSHITFATTQIGTISRTDKMIITGAGDVGIGAGLTSPSYKLDVDGVIQGRQGLRTGLGYNSYISDRLQFAASTGFTHHQFKQVDPGSGTTRLDLRRYTGSGDGFDTGEMVTFLANGNVGIGTTNPARKLQVAGDITINTVYKDFQSYSGTTNNLMRTWDGVLVAGSDNGGSETYTVIETSVPQDSYMMGGFTIDWFESYQNTNAKTSIKLGGYWNPESNGGFIGWEYSSTNPNVAPTIQVGRNSSNGNTVFILSHFSASYPIIVARDLWLGYTTGAETYGTGWSMLQTSSLAAYTNLDPVVARVALGYSAVSGTTNYVAKFTSSNSIGNSQIFDNGTNVGIGTTSPGSKLTIGTNFASTVGITVDSASASDGQLVLRKSASNTAFGVLAWDSQVYLSAGTYYDGGSWVQNNNDNNNLLFVLDPGSGARWYASDNGTGSWNVSSNIQLWNDSSNWTSLVHSTRTGNSYFTGGDVGIGTASPSYRLDVQGGSVRIGDATYNANLLFGNNQGSWGSGIRVYDNSDAEMRIWHMNGRGQIVLATGYNGNGSVAMPTDGLFIIGDTTASPSLKVGVGYTAANMRGGSAKFAVNGNVGIGISSPSYRLHLSGGSMYVVGGLGGGNTSAYSSANRIIFDNDYNDTARGPNKIVLYDSGWLGGFGVHGGTVSYYSGGNHRWYQATNATNATLLMTVNTTGIGAGTDPSYRLHVNGTGFASSDFRAPLFYDTDNTGYYVDPASTSNINRLYINYNSASSLANSTFNIATSTIGGIHFTNGAGVSGAGNEAAITFMGSSAAAAQAGIYVHNNNSEGTHMAFATTDSYATGPQIGLRIMNTGYSLFPRSYAEAAGSFRAPVFYDSNDTSYYLDANADRSSNINGFSARTVEATKGTYKYNIPRYIHTSDTNYWVGTMGWGQTDFNTVMTWGSGFFDTWSSPANSPGDTSHWVGVQAYHYVNAANSGYGWQLAGGVTDSLWWRHSWPSNSGWFKVAMYNNNVGTSSFYSTIMYDSNNTGYYVDPASTSNLNYSYIRNAISAEGYRFTNPEGGTYITGASTVTGAIKIKLPTDRLNSSTMVRFTVKLYEYSTGRSTTWEIGGYNYVLGNWYNLFATQLTDSGRGAFTVRFGQDATSDCVWIGETSSTWSYPQVFVTDVQTGYSGISANWGAGWGVSFVTSFDTVEQSRTASLILSSNNANASVPSLGVGTAASGTTGEIRATNEITAYYSDRRLKENVVNLADAYNKVKLLNGILYTPNDLAVTFGYEKDKKLVGLFADEVEAVLPEAVRLAPFDAGPNNISKSGENYKTIQYEKLVPLLIEAIKEQGDKIDELSKELRDLRDKYDSK